MTPWLTCVMFRWDILLPQHPVVSMFDHPQWSLRLRRTTSYLRWLETTSHLLVIPPFFPWYSQLPPFLLVKSSMFGGFPVAWLTHSSSGTPYQALPSTASEIVGQATYDQVVYTTGGCAAVEGWPLGGLGLGWRKMFVWPGQCDVHPQLGSVALITITLWLFNIAMENGPFADDFPIKTSIYKGFPWLAAMLSNQMVYHIMST